MASRLWAWPLASGLFAAFAASVLGAIKVPSEATLARFLWPGDTQAAASMLGFIASTTLTVLTTTISMTLIVLQVASGNFSHQLLRDFISSRAVRGILAVYVGVFSYSLLLLRSLDSKQDRPPQLAMTVSMVLVFVAVATFIWYVSRVVDMVRVDSVIDKSARRTLRRVDQFAEVPGPPVPVPEVPEDARTLLAEEFGYVQAIDVDHAARWAEKHDATVVVSVRPGDTVIVGESLARYWGTPADHDGEVPELPSVVYLESERVSGQDYSLGLRQLHDIAVRALSTGINDPTTAQHVIGQATSVLRDLAREPAKPIVRYEEDEDADGQGRLLVWAAVRTTAEVLQSFVGGVRRYAGGEPDVLIGLLRMLDVVEEVCDDDVRVVCRLERDRVVAAARREMAEPADLARVLEAAGSTHRTPPNGL